MKISFAKSGLPKTGALVVGVFADRALSTTAQAVDEATGGTLTRAMEAARFEGKAEQSLTLLCPTGVEVTWVIALGLGDPAKLDLAALQAFGGAACAALQAGTEKHGAIAVDLPTDSALDAGLAAANVAYGARLRSYRFDKYRTKEKKDDKPQLEKLEVLSAAGNDAKKPFGTLDAIADGVFLTRDLQSEPANILGPEEFAKECLRLEKMGVKVTVLGEKEMRKLGMGALLGVGQGSARESQVVAMEWRGAADKDAAPLAVVGKGVCFDSGGISIKPAGGMEDMKWDMGGAGVTIGLIKALAGRKAKVNVVGLVGLVENMPSGTAQRPGDVVTSMSGQTIEVINTDAEGRLVLCDVLTYCQKEFKPKAIVDLATLTGAIIISLGSEHAGLFSNDDSLAESLTKAGKDTGEKLWRMPLSDAYDKQIKSDIADMKNVGGREAGSITAAQFLQRFIDKGMPWAHLDIAGVTWSKKDTALVPKGGTAFGVRLLENLVAEQYEDKA